MVESWWERGAVGRWGEGGLEGAEVGGVDVEGVVRMGEEEEEGGDEGVVGVGIVGVVVVLVM